MKNYLKMVRIDEASLTPKYRQVADGILAGIAQGSIVEGDILPSIHDFCFALNVSKNSIEKAYNTLKKMGVISSIQGKGYFVFRAPGPATGRTLILFEQPGFHQISLESLMRELGSDSGGVIDLYVGPPQAESPSQPEREAFKAYSRLLVLK